MMQSNPAYNELPIDPDLEMFRKSFTNIRPEGDQIERIETLRDEYSNILEAVVALSDRTPNRTIALRKLEESLMYAVKSIVMEGA
jgi:hypothetical protein